MPVLSLRSVVAIGLCWGWSAFAQAAEPVSCEENVKAWAARCSSLASECVAAELCPPRTVILSAGCATADRIKVEITASPIGFQRAGSLTVSPIMDSPDWRNESEAKRRTFDAVAACANGDPSLISAAPPGTKTSARLGVPWLLFGGLALLTLLMARGLKDVERREGVAIVLIAVGCFVFRKALIPTAFFHQNGQGPFWVAFALEPDGIHSPYGTAYWEIFSRMARRAHDPETPIYRIQAIQGALVPLLGWIVWRGVGARRWLLWGAVAALALSPIHGRLAQSESYFATATFLLFAAAAALVLGFSLTRMSMLWPILSVIGAGLLIAEEARLHQLTWTAAAFIPFVILALPESPRRTVLWALGATLVIGLMVLVLDGHAMSAALKGELARHWIPIAIERVKHVPATAWIGLGLLVATVAFSVDRMRAALLGTALVVVLVVLEATRLIAEERTTVNHAYLLLWAPTVLTLGVALAAGVREGLARRLAQVGLVAGLLLVDAGTWRVDTQLATDSVEAEWARDWRKLLPDGSTVVYMGLTSSTARDLPLYGFGTVVPIERWVLTGGRPAPVRSQLPEKDVYYYESSLCFSPEAGDTCRQMHERFRLEPLAMRTVPSVESSTGDRLPTFPMELGLFRIAGPREP